MALILKLDDEAPSMVSNVLTLVVQRLKREESKCTQLDSHFFDWKVIVGPCDWEDHSANKDGAERYRVHNLPSDESPGVYELGVAVLPSGSGRVIKADQIVPVYVGQADNVTTRLRQYGRTGAHLGKSCSFGNRYELICKGPGLFQQMLARGYTIVYRWAPMRTKSEALRAERMLLDTFDYAWNTRSNASRRHDDVLQKLEKLEKKSSKLTRFTTIVPRHLPFGQKQVGIRIKSSKMTSTEGKFSDYADRESRNLIPQVIKLGRSQPRLLLDGSGISHENTIVCGVAVGDASICTKAPVQGRKRCAEHKGMKNTGSTTASNREFVSYESRSIREYTEICGAAASDGSTCKSPPVQGRKRCDEHKGMRNTGSTTASNREFVPYESRIPREYTEICGAAASDGSTCISPPVQGRKRCAEHKGMWNTGSTTASKREFVSYESRITREYTEICGATTVKGSACRRPPAPGRMRCAMHKGMRSW
ncbi:protein EFFECTOR OF TRANSCRIPTION 2 isoform X2 [Argentina anserina]|uniref:protein EFFECTOR OF TRANSCRIPTION 2 isoform X2 n=1 Tax=Argentina anserina TaxID=57926 RepID=UPI0021765886|nr:protein EFFECTOR OF TRANSCRIPTION 2 isoform X2 [Potentilla anserina]